MIDKKRFSLAAAAVLLLAVTMVMTLLFCSCKSNNYLSNIQVSPDGKSLIDLSDRVYEHNELVEIKDFDGTMNDFNKKYPFQCLRKKESFYRASYLCKMEVAVIIFDSYGNKQYGCIQQNDKSKEAFDKLLGSTLEEVGNFDPTGDYAFLYTGKSDDPRCSYHCTAEGYFVMIEYDDLSKVKNIGFELL